MAARFRNASHAFAYYVLAKIYCETDRETDAETLMPDSQRLCTDNPVEGNSGRDDACACILVAWLRVHGGEQLQQAFDKAAHLVDGYTLAEVNRNLCDVLRLCMQPQMQPLSTLESQTVSDTEATQFKGVESRNTAERDNPRANSL